MTISLGSFNQNQPGWFNHLSNLSTCHKISLLIESWNVKLLHLSTGGDAAEKLFLTHGNLIRNHLVSFFKFSNLILRFLEDLVFDHCSQFPNAHFELNDQSNLTPSFPLIFSIEQIQINGSLKNLNFWAWFLAPSLSH